MSSRVAEISNELVRSSAMIEGGHEGKKALEGPTPKTILTRCEPGRLAVRKLD